MSDLSHITKSIFSIGGPGTYNILGASDAGKNVFLEHQIRVMTKKDRVSLRNIAILASTAHINDEWNSYSKYTCTLKKTDNIKHIENIIDKQHKFLEIIEKKQMNKEIWKKRNATMIIVNDFIGLCNVSSIHNIFSALASKARHSGIYLVLLNQYKSTINPGIYTNSRVIVHFDKNEDTTKALKKLCFPTADPKAIIQWNMNDYHFTLWFVSITDKNYMYLKRSPLFCFPVENSTRNIKYTLI